MPLLSDARVRAARIGERPYKLFDTLGLYLKVETSGGRLWRLRYRHNGVERLLSLGTYPEISLSRAREKRDQARQALAGGIDPNVQRRAEKATRSNTFGAIALEWLENQRRKFAPRTYEKARWTIEDLIIPYVGSRPINDITPPELLAAFRRLEARGKHETAHRTKQRCGQIFRYAIATGRAIRDPTADLRGALQPVVTTNHAAITEPKKIGELLRAIHSYSGHAATEAAFKLAPLFFVRPGELRRARWDR